jgi:tetratricopeptide (TPR) repeat protein
MDTYYTIEEKYLKAVDKLNYGSTPKSLRMLNDIINTEPTYARAHYQLGLIYYYNMQDYQTAGYHLKLCTELEPAFPDVYEHYLGLLVFLNKGNMLEMVSANALQVPGVDHADVYRLLGMFAEKSNKWAEAAGFYRKALLSARMKKQMEDLQENIERIELKIRSVSAYAYNLAE